jgi:O-antigen/teichoic acid export membrane protein
MNQGFFFKLRSRVGRLTSASGKSSRLTSFVAFLSSSFAARAVTIGCQTLQVPLVIRGVGAEGFGYWMTLTSISYMMNFADLGMGMGLQNKLASAFALNEDAQARRLFASTFGALAGIGLALAAILCGIAAAVDFSAFFHLREAAVRTDAGHAAMLSITLLCVGLPLGLGQRLAYSLQLGWWHNTSQAVASVITLAAVAAVSGLHASFMAYFVAGLLPTALVSAGLIYKLCDRLGWRSWARSHFEFRAVRPVLSLGAHFSVQQLLNTVLYAAPPVLISAALGAAAVTPYNLVQRLFNVFGVAQNGLMNGLWPIYSEAHAREDYAWIQRTLWRSCLGTLAISITPLAVGAMFARPIIRLWVGHGAPLPEHPLIWLLFAWNACQFLQQPFWFLLAGVSQIHRLTFLSIAASTVCAGAMLLMVRPFGANGVVAGLLIGYAPFLLCGTVLHVLAYFRTMRSPASQPEAPDGAGIASPVESSLQPTRTPLP